MPAYSNCVSRCDAKRSACGGMGITCDQVCLLCLTETELSCLETKTCSELGSEPMPCGFPLDVRNVSSSCGAGTGGGSGAGGGGGRGGGTGGSGGGGGGFNPTYPSTLTISGKATITVTSIVTSDGKSVATVLSGEAKPITFSPEASDAPDLSKAGSVKLVSPSPGACTKVPTLSASATSHNVLVSVSAQDTLPSTACKDFMNAIKTSGLTMEYANVPYFNAKMATKVTVRLTK